MERSLVALCCIHFLVNMVVLLMAPFYPHVAYSKGVSPVLVGLVFSATPGTAFLCTLLTPFILKVIPRRTAIAIGCVADAVAMALLAVSDFLPTYGFFALGLVARIISGAAFAFVESSGQTHTAYSIVVGAYPERAKEVFSLLEMCAGIAAMAGPAISAPIYAFLGFQAIFLAGCVAFILCTFLVCFLKDVRLTQDKKAKYGVGRVLACRVRSTQPMCMDAVAVCYAIICLGVMETYVSDHLLDLGLPMSLTGAAISGMPASYTVCCLVFSRFLDRLRLKLVIQIGLVLAAISMLFMGPPPDTVTGNYWVVIAAIVLQGIAVGFIFVPCIPHMMEIAPHFAFAVDDDLSDALGSVGTGAFTLGETLGPLIGGALLDGMDFEWMAVSVAAGGPACLLFYSFLARFTAKSKATILDEVGTADKELIE